MLEIYRRKYVFSNEINETFVSSMIFAKKMFKVGFETRVIKRHLK